MVATALIFSSPLSYSPKSITTINGKLKTHHYQHHQQPQNKTKQNKKKNPIISYAHKKKNFPIINTTTNYINPPPSQPKLQTITTNIENPNTPTKNIQIGDPKLPTQTHKHIHKKKTQNHNQNQTQESLDRRLKSWKWGVGFYFWYIFMCGWIGEWVWRRKKERQSQCWGPKFHKKTHSMKSKERP